MTNFDVVNGGLLVRNEFTEKTNDTLTSNVKGKYSRQRVEPKKRCVSCCPVEYSKSSKILKWDPYNLA